MNADYLAPTLIFGQLLNTSLILALQTKPEEAIIDIT